MTILITGASGFIGSFVAEEALRRGYDTFVAVRSTSSRQYLTDPRLHFLVVDFASVEQLTAVLAPQQFDYVVHAAGATKAWSAEAYHRANVVSTQHLVEALLATQQHVRKFVFLSSLSVMGAIRETVPPTAILLSDTPQPNTLYGQSKLAAEQYLLSVADRLNVTILRPTGVYGPRERDYYMMVKSLAQHIDFAIGRQRQTLTFVFVSDVVQAVFCALAQQESGKAYFLTDGEQYDSTTFSRLVLAALGSHRRALRLVLPLVVARQVCRVAEWWSKRTGTLTALNNDKYHILAQRNWCCDVATTRREIGYAPQVTLADGVARTVAWYKQEGWI